MLGSIYFTWKQNQEWYELIVNEEDDIYEYKLTEKAPPEAVESFKLYQEKCKYARENGIVY